MFVITNFILWLSKLLHWDTSQEINPPSMPPTPIQPSTVLSFVDAHHAYHSVRVLCDELGATLDQKNKICGMVYQESRFLKGAIGKPNQNGTIDYGIAQFNNGSIRN